ncbi:nitroreductase [Xanthobacter sp. AM11]|uniref:nitroreductase n=1 Tax=Xanthobacter sp. AM11 TaxID=3380643 RepID=UPI0039BF75FE
MNVAVPPAARPSDAALAYHARTKHGLKGYAAGPETLDWDMQPNPFREFEGAPRTPLPLAAEQLAVTWGAAITPGAVPPAPLDLAGVALLLELSFGLAAWKQYGPDRWALRCNPSSGNLHPTEAYVLAENVAGLGDGLHHYVSRAHALEQRRAAPAPAGPDGRLWLGLSSIHWREAWKYGERAFRYCQLDLGHAIGAVRYAAGCLGWTVEVVEGLESAELAQLMGLDRAQDFSGAEPEDPDVLLHITPAPRAASGAPPRPAVPDAAGWAGVANVLDRHPMYRWPVIEAVSAATHGGGSQGAEADAAPDMEAAAPAPAPGSTLAGPAEMRAAAVILGRRSAQRFSAKESLMGRDTFFNIMGALLVRPAAPLDVWSRVPRLHSLVFVHRVEGLAPGVYALPRRPQATALLRAQLRDDFQWATPEGCPAHLPLYRLVETDCRGIARTLSCHQAIASDGSFALSMLAEFEPEVAADSFAYRRLHWEAGLLGQVLYLEAEAAGFRGTGIGCYFDDDLHRLVGMETLQFQSLYHFTVGRPAIDTRITTEPAYPGRSA